jgi:hypothetical protein
VATRSAGYLRDTNWPGATSCAMSRDAKLPKRLLSGLCLSSFAGVKMTRYLYCTAFLPCFL